MWMSEQEAQHTAITMLMQCRVARDELYGAIQDAHTRGVSKQEIHHITGLARTTINRILAG